VSSINNPSTAVLSLSFMKHTKSTGTTVADNKLPAVLDLYAMVNAQIPQILPGLPSTTFFTLNGTGGSAAQFRMSLTT
jgi:hypothetical protein